MKTKFSVRLPADIAAAARERAAERGVAVATEIALAAERGLFFGSAADVAGRLRALEVTQASHLAGQKEDLRKVVDYVAKLAERVAR
jgi:hypothetical protein